LQSFFQFSNLVFTFACPAGGKNFQNKSANHTERKLTMAIEHRDQIEKLGKHIDALNGTLARLGETEDLKRLIPRIKRPGWTTPAEIAFALGIAESLQAQVNAVAQLKDVLVKAGDLVELNPQPLPPKEGSRG
jgi:hypothetical protein